MHLMLYVTLALAVDSHTVHFQTTTRNKRTYEPACCIVNNTYATKLVLCPTIRSSLATPLDNTRDYYVHAYCNNL